MHLSGKRILITGAASGIGRALAFAFAERGATLYLLDRNEAGLKQTVEDLPKPSVKGHAVLDVLDRDAMAHFPERVQTAMGGLDVLINNAGVACHARFLDMREDDFNWVMDINYHAVVHLTRIFLPMLVQSQEARIVNLSSLFGLIAPADETTYVASKFAVRGFSLSLHQELRQDHPHVGVTVVHPGGIATNIAKSARTGESATEADRQTMLSMAQKTLTMPPEKAARIICRAIERNKIRVLVGADAKFLSILERLFPIAYMRILQWGMLQLKNRSKAP